MHLRCRPFQWPCRSVEVVHDVALPNAACPGLLKKPLDAVIRRLLAPYRPGGPARVTANKTKMKYVHTLVAISMALCGGTIPHMEEVHGFQKSHYH